MTMQKDLNYICPVCKGPIIDGGLDYYCPNDDCPVFDDALLWYQDSKGEWKRQEWIMEQIKPGHYRGTLSEKEM